MVWQMTSANPSSYFFSIHFYFTIKFPISYAIIFFYFLTDLKQTTMYIRNKTLTLIVF